MNNAVMQLISHWDDSTPTPYSTAKPSHPILKPQYLQTDSHHLHIYTETIYLKSNYVQWIETVETCLLSQIKFQDTDLLTHASTLLATNWWECTEPPSFGCNSLDAICERFNIPLETAGTDCSASTVHEEWNVMLQYRKIS